MATIPIYTIGYGNRSLEQFLALLAEYRIAFVVDVRSQPYSRFNPKFSRGDLENSLKQHKIRYVYMGDTLGGRPKDDSCYIDGRVDYTKLREQDFYQAGISRLRTAWEKQFRVAVMCTEIKPEECHRGKLIGNTLVEQGIDVVHIDEFGHEKGQNEVNQSITGGQLTLFEANEKMSFSRKIYF